MTYNGKTFSVVSIGDYAFRDCASITSITIPSSVRSIKSFAFFNCNAMTNVNMPASVTEIGMGAFEGCASLISIYCLAKTAPECEPNAFSKVDRTWCTLYIPKGSKSYKDNIVWREFFIEESDEKSEDINLNATANSK